MKTYAWEAP